MGSPEKANALLHYWISQHRPDFQPNATSSFEATVAHSIQEIVTDAGLCKCKLLVTPRLQNNYGTMNGGCMAALTCIIAGTALETLSARSGIVTSSSTDYLSAMPGNAAVEVVARVGAVTASTASVDILLQDCKTGRAVAKGRYTEQAPHTIRARASSYLSNAASAARSAVLRLQTAAEHALHMDTSQTDPQSAQEGAPADKAADLRHRAMASLGSAGASVRAAAQRLQNAADHMLNPTAAGAQRAEAEQSNREENEQSSTSPGQATTRNASDVAEQKSGPVNQIRSKAANLNQQARDAASNASDKLQQTHAAQQLKASVDDGASKLQTSEAAQQAKAAASSTAAKLEQSDSLQQAKEAAGRVASDVQQSHNAQQASAAAQDGITKLQESAPSQQARSAFNSAASRLSDGAQQVRAAAGHAVSRLQQSDAAQQASAAAASAAAKLQDSHAVQQAAEGVAGTANRVSSQAAGAAQQTANALGMAASAARAQLAGAAEQAGQAVSESSSSAIAKLQATGAAEQASTAASNAVGGLQQAASTAASAMLPEAPVQHQQSLGPRQSAEACSGENATGQEPTASKSPAAEHAKHALLQRIAMVAEGFSEEDCSCFDTTLGCMLKDIEVNEGRCSAVLPTTARLSNAQNQLHAGCYCSLVDLISTTALAAADKRQSVSITISVDFFAPLPIGEDLLVEARMVKAGKALTFAAVDFRSKCSSDLLAQGSHVEYSAGGAPYPDTVQEYHMTKTSQKAKL